MRKLILVVLILLAAIPAAAQTGFVAVGKVHKVEDRHMSVSGATTSYRMFLLDSSGSWEADLPCSIPMPDGRSCAAYSFWFDHCTTVGIFSTSCVPPPGGDCEIIVTRTCGGPMACAKASGPTGGPITSLRRLSDADCS